MNKEKAVKIVETKFSDRNKEMMIHQIERYYNILNNYQSVKGNYKVGDLVELKKGTLLHGTYKNIESLRQIVKDGLIASGFTEGRISKYPSCVSVWSLKKDCLLKEYINFYSGATIRYNNLLIENQYSSQTKTEVIPYDEIKDLNNILYKNQCRMWHMEQTKEVRFMPSLAQDLVQIGIIFDGQNKYTKQLATFDVLDFNAIDDISVKDFVNPEYYENFIKDRKNKDDFFTDREKAIIFGIPSNLIEGILVGRTYENDKNILNEIKQLLPNVYICNIDGKVIVAN